MKQKNIPYADPVRISCPHSFPPGVQKIAGIFRLEGHEIYLVGGSVRDLLLGREPHDHDFVLSADAEEMVRICKKYGLSYDDQYSFLNYVIAICGEDQFDLKTYTDNSLRLDLASRDFTMNALAYDLEAQEILDYMGGIEDIRRGIIRTSNLESFAEKPGNILRALRFSLEFNFRIEEETYTAMQENVSAFEHIRSSTLIKGMKKLLNGGRAHFIGDE